MSDLVDEQAEEIQRFSILVCIDGSEESYRGLRYAVRFGLDHDDTDIALLYVRPEDQALRSGGLNLDLARENMLDWDIELPGMKSLKKARDELVSIGFLGEEWEAEAIRKKARGSRLGDHMIEYVSQKTGQHIVLMLRVASTVLNGILDECHLHDYDLVIVSESDDEDGGGAGHIDKATAINVALEHEGTVLLAHALEEGHGHLMCVSDSEHSAGAARKDALIAQRCGCPIHLYAVAADADQLEEANHALELARSVIEETGYGVHSAEAEVGDPVSMIVEKGKKHSLIALSETSKGTLRRMLKGSVPQGVLEKAKNSVMIIR